MKEDIDSEDTDFVPRTAALLFNTAVDQFEGGDESSAQGSLSRCIALLEERFTRLTDVLGDSSC